MVSAVHESITYTFVLHYSNCPDKKQTTADLIIGRWNELQWMIKKNKFADVTIETRVLSLILDSDLAEPE